MNLLIFGLGYTASFYAAEAAKGFATITATKRRPQAETEGRVRLLPYDGADQNPDPRVLDALAEADALLVSAAPDAHGDPVLRRLSDAIARAPKGKLKRIVYLSTIGVYGDHQGAWIDETSELRPSNDRTRSRVTAENDWLRLGEKAGAPVYILRLAGIYGPGRSVIEKLRDGTAKRLIKPGQVFNRIHVADIAQTLDACFSFSSSSRAAPGGIYNVTDDEPAPPQDVVTFAAELLGIEPPPEQAFEATALTPMARSFYGENKRVRNAGMIEKLKVKLIFPTFRQGISGLLSP